MTIRFLADEHMARRILAGLQRQVDDIDIVRVQDVGLRTVEDPTILEWAANHDRVVVTRDIKTMPDFAYSRVAAGQPMPGVIVVPMGMSIGEVIAQLVVIAVASEPREWVNRVEYLPLR